MKIAPDHEFPTTTVPATAFPESFIALIPNCSPGRNEPGRESSDSKFVAAVRWAVRPCRNGSCLGQCIVLTLLGKQETKGTTARAERSAS